MPVICPACGGVVGRDCFNPDECMAIVAMQEQQRHYDDSSHHQIESLMHDMELLRAECDYWKAEADHWRGMYDSVPSPSGD